MDQQNRRRSSRKIGVGGILLRIALILLCLVLLSVYLMDGLYARYVTNASGSDSARVAAFDVVVNVNGDSDGTLDASSVVCTAVANGDSTYIITIENRSEVAVHYDLSVTITSGDKTGVTTSFLPQNADLAVGATGTSELTFAVDWTQFTSNKIGSEAEVTLAFAVTVNVTQID